MYLVASAGNVYPGQAQEKYIRRQVGETCSRCQALKTCSQRQALDTYSRCQARENTGRQATIV